LQKCNDGLQNDHLFMPKRLKQSGSRQQYHEATREPSMNTFRALGRWCFVPAPEDTHTS
jgi:hypothetical protein